ncbi:hypothetical protein ALO43_200070 [Pseudomonas tremae]|uniref:Transposase n=1 Tax=Pseudomonas tremae TaxID=200454 RepID=A0AA40P322_9PSED|nr:hypothetical protein ALO43_200070 [Pseudomonas tremae]
MRTRVAAADRAIVTTADDLAVLHHDCTDWHFAQQCALRGERQCLAHEVLILAAVDDLRLTHHDTSMAAMRPVSM